MPKFIKNAKKIIDFEKLSEGLDDLFASLGKGREWIFWKKI